MAVKSLTQCERLCQSPARLSVPSVAGSAARASKQPNFASELRRVITVRARFPMVRDAIESAGG